MTEIVRFPGPDGISVLVETDGNTSGLDRAARSSDGMIQAGKHLEDALAPARGTVLAALKAMHGLGFEQLTMEFGVKLSAETGAVIVKAAGEVHLKITATWDRKAEVKEGP